MANTYTQILIHCIFTPRGRRCCLEDAWREDFHKYATGIIQHRKNRLLAINSVHDHVHILIGLDPDSALSALMRDLKAATSKHINECGWVRGRFAWQEGYGAFSHSRSQLPVVARYIENQQVHHRRRSFEEEYRLMLERWQISYQDKHLFQIG